MTRRIPFCMLLLPLVLAACGFRPLYGAANGGSPAPGLSLAGIYVEPIPERVGYQLRNDLFDGLGSSGRENGAAYRLKLILRERTEGVTLQRDATITRYNYTLIAHYELIPVGAATPIKSGDVSALSAFNVASSPYATVIAERDAADRAAGDIADRIRTELAVYFREIAGGLN